MFVKMATINELFRIPPGESDVFSARFSNLSGGTRPQHLALGLGDGTVSIHQAATGKQLVLVPAAHHESVKAPSLGLPITALRWRPEGTSEFKVTQATSAKDVLLAAGSDGIIRHIHANSGRVLSTIVDEDSQIYACDYRALTHFFNCPMCCDRVPLHMYFLTPPPFFLLFFLRPPLR
jgi:hypothetical protein